MKFDPRNFNSKKCIITGLILLIGGVLLAAILILTDPAGSAGVVG